MNHDDDILGLEPSLSNVPLQSNNTNENKLNNNENPLFLHFVVVRINETTNDRLPEANILFKYSTMNNTTEYSLLAVKDFCFPNLKLVKKVSTFDTDSFVFVLTTSNAARLYGFCRRFLPLTSIGGTEPRYPECICLLVNEFHYTLYTNLLDVIQIRWMLLPSAVFPLLDEIANTTSYSIGQNEPSTPLVFGQRQQQSRQRQAIRVDVPLSKLFEVLSIDNVCKLISAILCEQRIIIVGKDNNINVLSNCVHAMVALIYPFVWTHVFIPIVPASLLQYVCAPMPFIMGIDEIHIDAILQMPINRAILVNLNDDTISLLENSSSSSTTTTGTTTSSSFDFPFPEELGMKLKRELKSLKKPVNSQCIADAFLAFFVYLLHHARFDLNHCALDERGKLKFDVKSFLELSKEVQHDDLYPLLKQMTQSQLFENFAVQRIQMAKYASQHVSTTPMYDLLYEQARLFPPSYTHYIKLLNEISNCKNLESVDELVSKRRGLNTVAKKTAVFASKTVNFMKHKLSRSSGGDNNDDNSINDRMTPPPISPSSASTTTAANHHRIFQWILELTSNDTPKHFDVKSKLKDVAAHSFHMAEFHHICEVLWLRLNDCKGKNWRHAHKSLGVIDYLIRYGNECIILYALLPNHLSLIVGLCRYEHRDSSVQERIRTLARSIYTLLTNVFELRNLRTYKTADIHQYSFEQTNPPSKTITSMSTTTSNNSTTAKEEKASATVVVKDVLGMDFFYNELEKKTESNNNNNNNSFKMMKNKYKQVDFYREESLLQNLPMLPPFSQIHDAFGPNSSTTASSPEANTTTATANRPTSDDLSDIFGIFNPLQHSTIKEVDWSFLTNDMATTPSSNFIDNVWTPSSTSTSNTDNIDPFLGIGIRN